jgi:hypothetical protein
MDSRGGNMNNAENRHILLGIFKIPVLIIVLGLMLFIPFTFDQRNSKTLQVSSFDDGCNHPLTEWKGPTANFSVSNGTNPKGKIVMTLYIVTDFGECGYIGTFGNKGVSGPVGQYTAGAVIDTETRRKVFGKFHVTEGDWIIAVKNESIVAKKDALDWKWIVGFILILTGSMMSVMNWIGHSRKL